MDNTYYSFIAGVACMAGVLQMGWAKESSKPGPYRVMEPGQWRFQGHFGQYIDTVSQSRILEKSAWDQIYPETEEAFEVREDDRAFPTWGAWRGEFWGKYILSTIAAADYYDSDELKSRVATATAGLLTHMQADGYLGTYQHPEFLEGENWNVWCRKYTLWGLLESYRLLQDQQTLEAAQKFADQLMTQVGPGKVDIVKTGYFYGMPSTSILQPMVFLYNATGEQKYLDFATYIVEQWSQHPSGVPDILRKGLEGKPIHSWFPDNDPYAWAKGYEFISCVEGLVELYKVTGNKQYLQAAENIHKALVDHERTQLGSLSFDDKLVGSAGLINTVAEICDAVYWNRLSFALFEVTGDERYVDEIERTLYNSLLCAYSPDGSWCLNRLRTSHLHVPADNHFLTHHHCCVDNLPRGLYQAAEMALMKSSRGEVFLSLFSEGEGSIQVGEDTIMLNIEGDFLSQSKVKMTLSVPNNRRFPLNIRMPRWSDETNVKINDKDSAWPVLDNWIRIEREWADGDVIEIEFDIKLRWEKFPGEKFDASYHPVEFYNEKWAAEKFRGGSEKANFDLYGHVEALDVAEAIPQQDAITFFYGPIALARDIRVSGPDIFAPIPEPLAGKTSIKSLPAPAGIWKLYEVDLGQGPKLRFCDFSSAGNTWDDHSTFNTWCLIKKSAAKP